MKTFATRHVTEQRVFVGVVRVASPRVLPWLLRRRSIGRQQRVAKRVTLEPLGEGKVRCEHRMPFPTPTQTLPPRRRSATP